MVTYKDHVRKPVPVATPPRVWKGWLLTVLGDNKKAEWLHHLEYGRDGYSTGSPTDLLPEPNPPRGKGGMISKDRRPPQFTFSDCGGFV